MQRPLSEDAIEAKIQEAVRLQAAMPPPRQLGGKRRERCVCAQLPADAPELRVYDGCAPDASRCRVPPAEAK